MYSFHEGIRGISLDPGDHAETLMPISGALFAVGVDFHAGTNTAVLCYLLSVLQRVEALSEFAVCLQDR